MFRTFLCVLVVVVLMLWDVGAQVRRGTFSCDGRTSGYYADIESGCQVYHMCDGLGRQFSYICPNATLFQQRMLICDHWYMVNCSKAEEDYSANLLIGQREKPFVEDSDLHPYQRTPRPDLVSPAGSSEYNRIYKTMYSQKINNLNLVGAETDYDENNDTILNETTYNLPSHWSTEYSSQASTIEPFVYQKKEDLDRSSTTYHKVETSTTVKYNTKRVTAEYGLPEDSKDEIQVNFPSKFKATTPVYPTFVEERLKEAGNFEIVVPESSGQLVDKSKQFPVSEQSHQDDPKETGNVKVNFPSNFQATTPVYPTFVEDNLKEAGNLELDAPSDLTSNAKVNFPSNFKATTPVYPTFVETNLKEAGNVELIAPNDIKLSKLNVNFPSNFKATTPVYPTVVDNNLKEAGNVELTAPNGIKSIENKVQVNFASNFVATTPVYPKSVDPALQTDAINLSPPLLSGRLQKINFASNFKATTPVYPTTVDTTSPIPDQVGLLPPNPNETPKENIKSEGTVNFPSNFKATTPVYPQNVDATSPNPQNVGLLPPNNLTPELLPPEVDVNFKERTLEEIGDISPSLPSKFYQPPIFIPDYTKTESPDYEVEDAKAAHTVNIDNWSDLRKKFFIPDYEFPLDSASRPSYDSVLSSFQASVSNQNQNSR